MTTPRRRAGISELAAAPLSRKPSETRVPPIARSSAPVPSTEATSSALPSPELERLFVAFRDDVVAFRNKVLESAGESLALPPDDQAEANLGIVRSVFGKWSIEILTVLVTMRTARFSSLRRTLKGISSDVLSRKLYDLESAGLIERRVWAGRPPTVEYRLTEDGFTMTRLGEPVLLFLRLRNTKR